jgi:hypothetical protein
MASSPRIMPVISSFPTACSMVFSSAAAADNISGASDRQGETTSRHNTPDIAPMGTRYWIGK